jgi:hypothetical protein
MPLESQMLRKTLSFCALAASLLGAKGASAGTWRGDIAWISQMDVHYWDFSVQSGQLCAISAVNNTENPSLDPNLPQSGGMTGCLYGDGTSSLPSNGFQSVYTSNGVLRTGGSATCSTGIAEAIAVGGPDSTTGHFVEYIASSNGIVYEWAGGRWSLVAYFPPGLSSTPAGSPNTCAPAGNFAVKKLVWNAFDNGGAASGLFMLGSNGRVYKLTGTPTGPLFSDTTAVTPAGGTTMPASVVGLTFSVQNASVVAQLSNGDLWMYYDGWHPGSASYVGWSLLAKNPTDDPAMTLSVSGGVYQALRRHYGDGFSENFKIITNSPGVDLDLEPGYEYNPSSTNGFFGVAPGINSSYDSSSILGQDDGLNVLQLQEGGALAAHGYDSPVGPGYGGKDVMWILNSASQLWVYSD